MKYAIRMLALVIGAGIAAPYSALAQAPAAVSLKADILKDWTGLKDTMTKIASEMPADKFNAKPTPAQQSFAERVVHIGQVNNRFLGAVGGTAKAPTIDAKAATLTKEAAIKAMQDSFDYGTALLNEQTDQTLLQAAAMPPAFLGPSTRARMFVFLVGHTWDIYGQMVVYLRLNGGVPPASQRP